MAECLKAVYVEVEVYAYGLGECLDLAHAKAIGIICLSLLKAVQKFARLGAYLVNDKY